MMILVVCRRHMGFIHPVAAALIFVFFPDQVLGEVSLSSPQIEGPQKTSRVPLS